MRRKGELSPAGIDRGWPHQVVLPARFSQRGSGYQEIHEFCKDLSICSRGHAIFYDREWFHVYCFSDPADADKFLQRFGGETGWRRHHAWNQKPQIRSNKATDGFVAGRWVLSLILEFSKRRKGVMSYVKPRDEQQRAGPREPKV